MAGRVHSLPGVHLQLSPCKFGPQIFSPLWGRVHVHPVHAPGYAYVLRKGDCDGNVD